MSKSIPLYNRKRILVATTIVDDENYDLVVQWRWYFNPTRGYVQRNYWADGRFHMVRMHRFILGVTDSSVLVDHRDRDKLNNQRHNLRICTPSQNAMNRAPKPGGRSQYKGVSWNEQSQKWRAFTADPNRPVGKRSITLGHFAIEIEAARVHDRAALHYHGEFALLNFKEQSLDV